MILSKGMSVREIALASAPERRSYRIERVSGQDQQAYRLSEMGLVPGAEVSVMSRCHNGMIVVKVGGSRLALARGMADGVWVK